MTSEEDISGIPSSEIWGITGRTDYSPDYTILGELSSSPYYAVYQATHRDRKIVLKTLKPDVRKDGSMRELLHRESEILMSLSHVSIVETEGIVDVPGLGQCLVMEYVEGTTLDVFLREHTLQLSQKLVLLRQLLLALDYIHGKGYVHRDIKPTNILVRQDGEHIKIIDFGLADASKYLVAGQTAGTMGYASPEQMAGSDPDARNDIYSIGCIMRDMQLGKAYDNLIAQCLGPLPQRPSALALVHALGRVVLRKRLCKAGKGCILLAVILVAISMWRQYNSVYRISSAKELMAYAALVNEGKDEKDAILTADIDLEGYDWVPIGNSQYHFSRHFDGQGHRILHLCCNRPNDIGVGFVGIAKAGTVVSNLILDRTCTIHGGKFVGIVGACLDKGRFSMHHLGNEGSVYASDCNAAGILGCVSDEGANVCIDHCYSRAEIFGRESAQICAWSGNALEMAHCWSTSRVDEPEVQRGLVRFPKVKAVSFANCFSTLEQEVERDGCQSNIPIEDFVSGTVAVCMNDAEGSSVWHQTIGTDSFPTFLPGAPTVYADIVRRCDGRLDVRSCSNNPALQHEEQQHHIPDKDGICQREGCTDIYPEPEVDTTDGFHKLKSVNDLLWLTQHRNASAKLMADIDFSQHQEMIEDFAGILNGQGHAITIGYDSDLEGTAFVRNLSSVGEIRNLIVRGRLRTSARYAGGIVSRHTGTISHCVSLVNIESTVEGEGYHGGIYSFSEGDPKVRNSLFAGSIRGPKTTECGRLDGMYIRYGVSHILLTGPIEIDYSKTIPIVYDKQLQDELGHYENFTPMVILSQANNIARISPAQIADGTALRLLTQDQSIPQWTQRIGKDPYPMPIMK